MLFVATLNEFDFNYLGLKYFSFNFPFILIYYWSLKRPGSLGYGLIFLSGLFNDAVVGLPIGVSSLSYLFICGFSSYLRNITIRPHPIKVWFFFLLYPIIPNSSLKALNIFDIKESQIKFSTISENEYLKHGQKINMIDILFKKIEKKND